VYIYLLLKDYSLITMGDPCKKRMAALRKKQLIFVNY